MVLVMYSTVSVTEIIDIWNRWARPCLRHTSRHATGPYILLTLRNNPNSVEYSLSDHTIITFKLQLHLGPSYTPAEFHVCTSNCCIATRANEILLDSAEQTPAKILVTTYVVSTPRDMSPESLSGLLRQTDRQTDGQTLWIKIPAFAITAGRYFTHCLTAKIYTVCPHKKSKAKLSLFSTKPQLNALIFGRAI